MCLVFAGCINYDSGEKIKLPINTPLKLQMDFLHIIQTTNLRVLPYMRIATKSGKVNVHIHFLWQNSFHLLHNVTFNDVRFLQVPANTKDWIVKT